MNRHSKNFSSLDLFRGVAGYGVAICHFYYYLHDLSNFQFFSIFFVEFFFILSGFVLYPQLQKVYNNGKNIKIFYFRRWLRTIPPYILALVCFSVLFAKFDSDTFKYLFFLQKITENFVMFDYFSVAWSLSVEEFFYLLFPIFLVVLNKRKFIHILLLFISLIYILKITFLFLDVSEEFYRIGTFLRLDAIGFGVLTRIYFEKIKYNFLNLLSAILITISMYYFMSNIKNLANTELFIFILLIQLFSINAIILFINFDKFIVNSLLINLFSLLSKQTYSIYLFHFAILHFISSSDFLLNSKFVLIYYLIFLFIFSSISYYVFEKVIVENRPKYKFN